VCYISNKYALLFSMFFGRWIFGVLIFDFDFDYLHGI